MSSIYKIIFTEKALHNLNNIDKENQKKIAIKLKNYSKEPFKYARKLLDPKIGSYRFRIGDYRVIFDIEKNNIVILKIGHRKDIYK
jgi:mRNA interferase RelE/StbE